MTDDAIEQFPEPTPAEASALAVLDRRGRRAAAALTAVVAAHVEGPAGAVTATRPAGPFGGTDDVPLTLDLSAGGTRRTAPSGRASARAWWLAAAAVASVVGLVAAVTLQTDERTGVSSRGPEVAPPAEPGDGAAPPPPREHDQAEVAAGVRDGEPWRLLATRRPGFAALDLVYGNGSAGLGWVDAGPLLPLEVSWSQSAGWPVPALTGVVADGATVTVEVPGRPPVTPELAALPGWDHHGFVAFVPDLDEVGAVVIARGPDGQEIARDAQGAAAPRQDGPTGPSAPG
jgi:hypothetical protein